MQRYLIGVFSTVRTDENGWYSYNYKYTGKPAAFTVTLIGYPDYPKRARAAV